MPAAPWKTWTALALVYVVWGSTYLAIRYVVEGLPPLLTAATRFFLAAALIAAFMVLRRGREAFRGSAAQWRNAAVVGLLLLLCGNGGVTIAEEQHLPSGLTALLVAGVPLFVVLLRLVVRDRPAPRTVLGVAIGFVGLAVLLLPGARPTGVPVLAAVTVVGASLAWSVGSFVATRVALPQDPLAATIGEMLGGGAGLLLAGLARGEHLDPRQVTGSSLLALAYLVVFGSVVAFTAYSWLLGTAPVSTVATYAYVNPVVAVLLGALVAGEPMTAITVVGGAITVVAVAVVVSERRRPGAAAPSDAPEPYVPDDRQGRVRSSRT